MSRVCSRVARNCSGQPTPRRRDLFAGSHGLVAHSLGRRERRRHRRGFRDVNAGVRCGFRLRATQGLLRPEECKRSGAFFTLSCPVLSGLGPV